MRDRIKEGNFINIQSWMVTKLKLKGNELLTYALIYGFSQNGSSSFKGSRSYIAEWCNTSLPTIDKAIKSLVDKKLIFKDSIIENKVTYNIYQANIEVVNNLYGGSKETLQGGSKETLYNNNILNNNINNINNRVSYQSQINEIIDYMNNISEIEETKVRELFKFKKTSSANVKIITARLKEGYKVEEFKDVIYNCYLKFVSHEFNGHNGKSSIQYFKPTTIFTSSKMEQYLNEYEKGTNVERR